MITSISYLTRNGNVGSVDYSGPASLAPIANALESAGITNVVRAVALTDEPAGGHQTIDAEYGCRVAYSWLPGSLSEVAAAYRLAGREMDAVLS
jgi:hypothetical protein